MRTQEERKPKKNRIASKDEEDTSVASDVKKPDLVQQQQKKRLIKMTAAAESWRFIALFCFWAMCLFAIAITRLIVVDRLAAGPEVEGDPSSSCEPFNQENPGLVGQGFDFDSANHLLQQFGFSPLCANWDYSPARELTAMFYPLFEYSLLIYLALDFYTIKLSYQRGESSKWFWTLTKIFFPIEIILTAWFRMIFIVESYGNSPGYGAGFLGFIVLMILVTIQNCIYILDSSPRCRQVVDEDHEYKFLGAGLKGTRVAVIIYLISNLIINGCMFVSIYHIVKTGEAAAFTAQKFGSFVVGRDGGTIWMLFNVVLPTFIAFFRARTDHGLAITLIMVPPKNHLVESMSSLLNTAGAA